MSMEFNMKIATFNKLFPEVVEEHMREQRKQSTREREPADGAGGGGVRRRRTHAPIDRGDGGGAAPTGSESDGDDGSLSDDSSDEEEEYGEDGDFFFPYGDRSECTGKHCDLGYARRRSAFADNGSLLNLLLMCLCVAILSLPLYNLHA